MTDKEKSDLFMNTKDEAEAEGDDEKPADDENRLVGEQPEDGEKQE